jgi:hypothetical protein
MARDGVPRRKNNAGFEHDGLERWLDRRTAVVGRGYAGEFYLGFDGWVSESSTAAAKKGYRDGQRSCKAVLARYGDVL